MIRGKKKAGRLTGALALAEVQGRCRIARA